MVSCFSRISASICFLVVRPPKGARTRHGLCVRNGDLMIVLALVLCSNCASELRVLSELVVEMRS